MGPCTLRRAALDDKAVGPGSQPITATLSRASAQGGRAQLRADGQCHALAGHFFAVYAQRVFCIDALPVLSALSLDANVAAKLNGVIAGGANLKNDAIIGEALDVDDRHRPWVDGRRRWRRRLLRSLAVFASCLRRRLGRGCLRVTGPASREENDHQKTHD